MIKALRHTLLLLILPLGLRSHAAARPTQNEAEKSLAVIDAGVERSEDAPAVSRDFRFLPGEYVYFKFQISGFATKLSDNTEVKSLHLQYEVAPRDAKGVALCQPLTGAIEADLGKEDKNWIPKRRASFLLPSFVAAGRFNIHVVVKDLIAKIETTRDVPFDIGGVHVGDAASIQAETLEFLRHQDDLAALDLPAYAPGDTIWARFQMIGFQYEAANKYRLSYGLQVLRPDGKVFLRAPEAAQISSDSYYPAPYVPGDLQITTPKDAPRGTYQLILTVRDEVAGQSFNLRRTFTIE